MNSRRHGKGILYRDNNTIIYDGDWVDNKREGFGKALIEKGIDYKFDFVSNKYIETENNHINKDAYYIGHWRNNLRHDDGKLLYKNNSIIFIGEWVNDKIEGYGKYVYYDGRYYMDNGRSI